MFVFVLFALEHYYNMVAWVFSIGCLRQLMTLQFCDVLHFENIFSYLIKIHFSKFKSERDTTTTDMESYPIKFLEPIQSQLLRFSNTFEFFQV